MSKKVVGIDIRHDGVSAVLVKSGIKGNWIESHIYVPLPDDKSQDPPPAEGEEAEETAAENKLIIALETIADRMDTGGAVFVASFPADQISYRNIQLPFKDQKKIRQVLPFELEPLLPFPPEELTIDFHSIKLPDSEDHTDIITAAVENSELKLCLDTLTKFQMEPEMISVGGYSTALCLAKFANISENCFFMDISADKCTAFIIISGQICLIRSFPISSDAGRTQSLCTDIQRTLAAFEEIFHLGSNFQPDEILITGYGVDNIGFEREAERILQLPVIRTDLVRDTRATIKRDPTTAFKTSAQLDNAYSLALMEIEGIHGLNFRRGFFAPKQQWAEHKTSFIKTGVLAALLLAAIFLNMVVDSYTTERKLAKLDKQIMTIFKETFPEITRVVDPLHQMQIAMQDLGKEAFSAGEKERSIRAADIINEISKRIPKETDVVLTRLLIGSEKVEILGNTDSITSVDDIKNRLEAADIFKEVTIASSTTERVRVRFNLKVQL